MQSGKEQVLGLVILFLVLSLITREPILVLVALGLLFGALLELRFILTAAEVWHKFVMLLITTISNTLLVVLFYLVVGPYSFLYRLFHGPQVKEFIGGKETTAYKGERHTFTKADFENPW